MDDDHFGDRCIAFGGDGIDGHEHIRFRIISGGALSGNGVGNDLEGLLYGDGVDGIAEVVADQFCDWQTGSAGKYR